MASAESDAASALLSRAAACLDSGRAAEARALCEQVLLIHPESLEAHNNLALALRTEGRLEQARAHFEAALALDPNRADVHANLGVVMQEQGNLRGAIECYRRALALRPDLAGVHYNLAQALRAQSNVSPAIAEVRQAIRLDPANADAHFFLGHMLHIQGLRSEALSSFARAIALRPNFVQARWSSTMTELAVAYGPGESPEESRAAFAASLASLEHWLDEARPTDAFRGVGSMQPYYLAYHDESNVGLLSRYGDLCARLMAQWWSAQGLALPAARRAGKLRIGIASGTIYDQSVWTAIVKGWCRHLDQDRFELHLLYTGKTVDRETELARSLVPRFVDRKKNLREWVDEILSRRFDVLVYPEIGMDPVCIQLASLRLAPAQAAAWGHPETTGLPTIDYYLSAQAFEPPGAQANYRERLVTLPGMGCFYEPHDVAVTAPRIDDRFFDSSSILLLCAGTPYKYDPRHDGVFVEIARKVAACRLVFVDDNQPNLSRMLQKRLELAFADAGLEFGKHAAFVPHQDRPAFHELMQRADVLLDTIGFSGFNTAMQALECGLPIVAYEGQFMRGRFASGLLRQTGLAELVATTEAAYVELVARLANDVAYLQRIRGRIADSGAALLRDRTAIASLEDFLTAAAGRAA